MGPATARRGQPRQRHFRRPAQVHAALHALQARQRHLRPLLGPQFADSVAHGQPEAAAVPPALHQGGGAGRRRETDVLEVRRAAQVPEVVHGAQVPAGARHTPQEVLPHGAVPRQTERARRVPPHGARHVALRRRQEPGARLQPVRRQQPFWRIVFGPLHGVLQAPLHGRLARVQRLQSDADQPA